MTITTPLARDEMFAQVTTAWNAQAGALNGGTVPELLYQGLNSEAPQNPDKPYGRMAAIHTNRPQDSFRGDLGRRYENLGLLTVQCYAPLQDSRGLSVAEALAIIARNAVAGRRTPGGVWFRNCRVVEIGKVGSSYQVNMLAEFVYDEII